MIIIVSYAEARQVLLQAQSAGANITRPGTKGNRCFYYIYCMIATMKTKKRGLLLCSLMVLAVHLFAQDTDTISLGYQIGYHIGSWLPFSIIILLALLILLKSSRQRRAK